MTSAHSQASLFESDADESTALGGGFPCQGIAAPGKRRGLDDPRSGLWFEMLRIVSELRPAWVVIENSRDLRTRGIDTVLGALEKIGYACWPLVVGARHVGALHNRDRVWIIAHTEFSGLEGQRPDAGEKKKPESRKCGTSAVQIATRQGTNADADAQRFDARPGMFWREGREGWQPHGRDGETFWSTEPDVVRVVHGLPGRVDRIAALGNAVVPQVAYTIARLIADAGEHK